jgi:hypothetical protein
MTESAQVGAQVEAQCGRCHDATNHVVLTVEKDKPKRGRCTVCEAEHLYRKPKGLEEPGKPRRSAKDDPAVLYANAMEAAPEGESVKYTVKIHLNEGQRVQHKSFGEGIVLRVVRPQVAEVIFPDGARLLAMDR